MPAISEETMVETRGCLTKFEVASRRIATVVIDDSATFMEVVWALLERENEVDLVARGRNGIDAIEMVAKLDPDLVLMDIDMPRLDGLNAALIISCCFPRSRILLMSAEESPELQADCHACGAAGFICKDRFRQDFSWILERIVWD